MKKYFVALAAIVFAFAACNKEVENQQPTQKGKRHITVFTETPGTRTVLDNEHNALLWAEGDNFRLMTDTEETTHDAQTLNYVSGGKFDVEVSEDAEVAYAYYYAGTYTDANHSTPKGFTAYINPTQAQSKAGVLNGQNLPMAAKGAINDDNTVSLEFHQMAGVLALNIYSTDKVAGEVINSITVTPTANTKFCGPRTKTDLTGENVIFDEGTSTDSKYSSIKVELEEPYDYASSKPTDKKMFGSQIYVVLAKQSYSAVKFEIETNKGTYEITSNGTAMDLTANDFYPVNINLAKATFTKPATAFEWNLVTSASQVVPGAEVVIAAKDAAVAMSQTQNTNNRATAAIAKTGSTITWTEESLVQVFEIEAGSKENTIAFKCANGSEKGHYIYAASKGSNHLKTENAKSDNSSWTIAISDTDNAVTLLAQGDNTRNYLQYNSSNNPPIFSCYASTTTNQDDIVLYIKGEAADPDAKAIISNGTIEVAATGVAADYEGAYSLKNIDEDTETIILSASENILEPFALGGDVTFSMAPNYGSSKVNGSITLSLASDANISATIPVEQKGSTLKTSVTEVVIPADATETSFTVTSPEFGWSITADNTNVVFTETGEASSSAVTVTVSSEVAAAAESQTLATLTISRTENDPQKKTITIKKAEIPTSTEAYVKATSISEGIYLMVYNSKAASSFNNGALVASSVTINNDEIASTSIVDQYAIEIASLGDDQYSLKLGNSFIGYNSSTNLRTGTSVASDNYKWTITIEDDGTAYIVNVGTKTRYIGGNASGDSFTQFKAYATSNIATYPKPTLYKFTGE